MPGIFDDRDTDPMAAGNKPAPTTAAEIRDRAHIANGGNAAAGVDCADCSGRGFKILGYHGRRFSCFRCNGTGKLSARQDAARRGAISARENLADRRAAFEREHADMLGSMRRLADRDTFFAELLSKLDTYGSMTENQIAAVLRSLARIAERRDAKRAAAGAGKAVEISAIDALFGKARETGLKKLAFRTERLVISAAKDTGRNPGALYVKDRGEYVGKIVGGRWQPTGAAGADVLPLLEEIAKDPAGAARFFGRKTGVCCCCGRELTDPESVAAGIGPICAQGWGL